MGVSTRKQPPMSAAGCRHSACPSLRRPRTRSPVLYHLIHCPRHRPARDAADCQAADRWHPLRRHPVATNAPAARNAAVWRSPLVLRPAARVVRLAGPVPSRGGDQSLGEDAGRGGCLSPSRPQGWIRSHNSLARDRARRALAWYLAGRAESTGELAGCSEAAAAAEATKLEEWAVRADCSKRGLQGQGAAAAGGRTL
jgi:hypothetical protein